MLVNVGLRRFSGGIGRLFNSATFFAPLKTSLALERGTGALTYTRATTAYVSDYEGVARQVLSGEARFTGARRVRNGVTGSSEDLSSASWTKSNVTITTGISDPNGGTTACTITATAGGGNVFNTIVSVVGQTRINSAWIRRRTGTGTVTFRKADNTAYDVTALISGTWTRITTPVVTLAATSSFLVYVLGTNGDAIDVAFNQNEDITGRADQTTPSEYVSVGVLSAPYHGTGVDGVKCFDTTLTGAAIASSTLKGYLAEALRTQYLGATEAPATQTTSSLGTGTYTLWVEGSGSASVAGATATITGGGSASSGTPRTFIVTVAGTVTVTVTGSLTRFQVENGAYAGSYIINSGAAGTTVNRNGEVDSYPTSGNITATVGTVYLEFNPTHAPSGTIFLWGTYVDANNYTAILHDGTNMILRKRIAGVNTDATVANAFVSGTRYRVCGSWGAAGQTIYVNGSSGTHANTASAQVGTTMQWGADGNSLQQPFAHIANGRVWQRQLSGSEQAGVTA